MRVWVDNGHEEVEVFFTSDLFASFKGAFTADLANIVGSCRSVVTIGDVGVRDGFELVREEGDVGIVDTP